MKEYVIRPLTRDINITVISNSVEPDDKIQDIYWVGLYYMYVITWSYREKNTE